MKANELRIGNWFIEYNDPQEFDGDFYHLSDIKFIELTEEWLLKFGFEFYETEKANNYKYSIWRFTFVTNGKTKGKKYANIFNALTFKELNLITYVHQLQNLHFALTGEELTIKQS